MTHEKFTKNISYMIQNQGVLKVLGDKDIESRDSFLSWVTAYRQ